MGRLTNTPDYLNLNMANTNKRYTDEEKETFCALAQQIGIGRSIRQLGYPAYPTAIYWLKARNIEPNADKMMAAMKAYHTYYTIEDIIIQFDNAVTVAEEMLMDAKTPDDLKRIADALYKIVQTRQLLEGKATVISEKRETTQQDLEIMELLNMERARNENIEEQQRNEKIEADSAES